MNNIANSFDRVQNVLQNGKGFEVEKVNCFSCKASMAVLIPMIGSNATQQDLLNLLDTECAKLPSDFEEYCDEIAQSITDQLPRLEKDLNRYEPIGLCSILGFCKVDCCLSKDAPEQIKISFAAANHSSMYVTWVGKEKSVFSNTKIEYRQVGSSTTQQVQVSQIRTYTKGGWEGYIYVGEMTSIKPGKVLYEYRVSHDVQSDQFSEWIQFYSAILPGKYPTTIGYIADMGTINSAATLSNLKNIASNHQVDFMIHAGDISYADAYQHTWDVYCREMQPITSTLPYMTCPGNHEIPWNFIAYKNRWTNPWRESGSVNELWYSFNYGQVHYISANTELLINEGWVNSKEQAWIEQDLKAVDKSVTPWVVFFTHRPSYCSIGGIDCGSDADLINERLEPLFYKYGVDLALSGHKHAYERLWPTYKHQPTQKDYINPNATVYVVNGAAGNNEGLQHHYDDKPFSAAHYVEFGYSKLIAHNSTHLQWQFLNEQNQIVDDFTISKTN